jgi:hypothetical protein
MMDEYVRRTERWDVYRNGRLWQRFDSLDLVTEAKQSARERYPQDRINVVHIVVR